MLTIRFQRMGRVNDPSFRIVVIEKTSSPKAGKNVAVVGSHNPKTKQTIIDGEAVKGWLAQGAQASGTVHNLLISKGIIEGKKINVLQKKSAPQKEETPAPAGVPTGAPVGTPVAEGSVEMQTAGEVSAKAEDAPPAESASTNGAEETQPAAKADAA